MLHIKFNEMLKLWAKAGVLFVFLVFVSCSFNEELSNNEPSPENSLSVSDTDVDLIDFDDLEWCVLGEQFYQDRKVDFKNLPSGRYNEARFECDFGNNARPFLGADRSYLIESSHGNHLKIRFDSGVVGARDNGILGAFTVPSKNEYFIHFRVWFDEDFDFTRGMKLIGFCGGTCNTGGNMVQPDDDGWSARLMVRRGDPLSQSGDVFPYVYHRDMNSQFGENFNALNSCPSTRGVFQKKKWHSVQIYVKMNDETANSRNGVMKLWIDGKTIFYKNDIRYREGVSKVDRVLMHVFPGGSDQSYAPNTTGHLRFNVVEWWSGTDLSLPYDLEEGCLLNDD